MSESADAQADVESADPESQSSAATINAWMGQDQLPRVFWRGIMAIGFSVAMFLIIKGTAEKLESLIKLLVISLFVSFALEPVVNRLAKRGWKRGVATMTCFLVVFGLGGVFAGVMVNLVVEQTSDLAERAPGYVTDITKWVNRTFDTEITSKQLNQTIRDYQDDLTTLATSMGGRVVSVTGAVLGSLFQVLSIFLFSFYMVAEGPQMRRKLCSVLPERRQKMVLDLWELSIAKTGGWVYSRVILALCSAVSSWVLFTILGLPSPLALALWMGLVSQFIPVVGTYLGGAVPLLVALMSSPLDALWVIGWILVYQQVENYVLAPRITSQTMDLHPAVAFGAALAGGSLVGVAGAILALPAAAVIQAFVSSYLNRHEVVESNLTDLTPHDISDGGPTPIG
ncbi:MAG: AI-2E family transporter [Microthrixaceae bacterium]